jgi:hypothetical protein
MGMCGYHLRCSNYGHRCSECSYQHNDKNKDYLRDVLNLLPKSKEPMFAVDFDPFQKVNIMSR